MELIVIGGILAVGYVLIDCCAEFIRKRNKIRFTAVMAKVPFGSSSASPSALQPVISRSKCIQQLACRLHPRRHVIRHVY